MSVTEVEEYAIARHEERYAGIAFISGRLTIYRIPGESGFDDDIRAQFPGIEFHFVDAVHSFRQLCKVRDTILADRESWFRRGVRIVSTTVAYDGSFVEIGTPQSNQASRLQAWYGEDLVRIVVMDAAHPL